MPWYCHIAMHKFAVLDRILSVGVRWKLRRGFRLVRGIFCGPRSQWEGLNEGFSNLSWVQTRPDRRAQKRRPNARGARPARPFWLFPIARQILCFGVAAFFWRHTFQAL